MACIPLFIWKILIALCDSNNFMLLFLEWPDYCETASDAFVTYSKLVTACSQLMHCWFCIHSMSCNDMHVFSSISFNETF